MKPGNIIANWMMSILVGATFGLLYWAFTQNRDLAIAVAVICAYIAVDR